MLDFSGVEIFISNVVGCHGLQSLVGKHQTHVEFFIVKLNECTVKFHFLPTLDLELPCISVANHLCKSIDTSLL